MATQVLGWTAALGAMALALPVAGRAPATTRYRIEQSLTQEVDASAAGQGRQTLSFTTTSFVTVTLTDSARGKAIRVLVDSMRGDSASPIPAEVLDSARGAEFRGFVTPEGRPTPLQPSGANSVGPSIQGLVSDFFPWVRAGIRVGESWADTASATSGEPPDTVTVRRITRYRAAATEKRGSGQAVKVATESVSEVEGFQPTQQGSARLQGSGTGKGSYFVSPEGVYLGGEWESESSLTISGAFAPQPVPVMLRQTTRVAALP